MHVRDLGERRMQVRDRLGKCQVQTLRVMNIQTCGPIRCTLTNLQKAVRTCYTASDVRFRSYTRANSGDPLMSRTHESARDAKQPAKFNLGVCQCAQTFGVVSLGSTANFHEQPGSREFRAMCFFWRTGVALFWAQIVTVTVSKLCSKHCRNDRF